MYLTPLEGGAQIAHRRVPARVPTFDGIIFRERGRRLRYHRPVLSKARALAWPARSAIRGSERQARDQLQEPRTPNRMLDHPDRWNLIL